jgi:hypothetical protein
MKITINRNSSDNRQSPIVTIDTTPCTYPYAIREAIELALSLDGYTQETINEVFYRIQDNTLCKENTEDDRGDKIREGVNKEVVNKIRE